MNCPHLFEPFSIGTLKLKNRIMMGPLGTAMADENQRPSPIQAAYYATRAKGGMGLLIVEHTAMQKVGARSATASGIWDREGLPQWKMLVDAIHQSGPKVGIQIGHQGPSSDYPRLLGTVNRAPSAVRCRKIQEETRAVTLEEMAQFKKDYVEAVKIAVEAGFDTVVLHLTNGYFLAAWLSGRTNKRTDRYGGTLENRLRFPLELIAEIRKAIGPDFPLIARLASREVLGGRSLEETRVVAKALQDAGIDALDINAGSWTEYDWEFPSFYKPEGFLLEDAEKIKRSVDIPIIHGGRIIEPRMAEQALSEGRIDVVSITRGLLADPKWVEKTANGEDESIRRCIGCTRCINDREQGGLICSVNPFVRKEIEWAIKAAEKKKKILVIGGGVGGLQAASIAAQRGHDVTLAEKEDQFGGVVRAGGVPPMKWQIFSLITALGYEVKKHGVKVLMNTTVTADWVKAGGFDEVIVATGARPVVPRIPSDGSLPMITAMDVLLGKEWVGSRVAFLGGGAVGCECADFIAEYRKQVTIFEMLDRVANDMFWNLRDNLLAALKENDVVLRTSCMVLRIEKSMIYYEHEGKECVDGPFDSLVVSVGLRPDLTMANELESLGIKPILVGDIADGGRLYEVLTSAVRATINL